MTPLKQSEFIKCACLGEASGCWNVTFVLYQLIIIITIVINVVDIGGVLIKCGEQIIYTHIEKTKIHISKNLDKLEMGIMSRKIMKCCL